MKKTQSTIRLLATSALVVLAAACGTPDEEPGAAGGSEWVGKTYLLRTTIGDWITPRGIGQDIAPYVPGFLIRVDSAMDGALGVTMGTVPAMGADQQDPCTATRAITGSAVYPNSTIGPTDFVMHLTNSGYAVNANVRGLRFDNVLPGSMEDGTLTATLDFREIVNLTLAVEPPDPMAACTALEEARMAPCVACPHDGQPFCLTIVASPVVATEFAGTMTDIPTATCPDMLRTAAGAAPAPAATP